MDMSQVAANAGGIFSSIFLIASYTMTTMIPLRIFGILTNLVLITFSFTTGNYHTMILHMVLLPLNSYRLHQMLHAGARREEVGEQRPVDGLAEAVHDRASVPGRRGAVLQGREGRGDVLRRQRPLPAGGDGDRVAHRHAGRRNGHAVAEQQAHRHARMHRERPDPRRYLPAGRGAVCAEPGLRLLFPAAGQRAAVRESPSHGGAGRGARPLPRRRRPRTSRLECMAANLLKPFRALGNWLLGEDDHHIPPVPQGLPADFAQALDQHVRMLVEFQNTEYAVLYLDRLGRFHERRWHQLRRCFARSPICSPRA